MSFIKRLMGYITRNWTTLSGSILCIIVTTFISVQIPRLGGEVIENILVTKQYDALVYVILQILVLTGILGVFSFLQRYANAYFSQKVIYNIRDDAFSSLQRQSFSFYDKAQTGQLISKVTTDVERIQRFLGWQLMGAVGALFLLGGVLAAMISVNWRLTLLSFATAPLVFFAFHLFGKKIRPVIQLAREHYGALASVLWESLVGIRVVRAFAREDFEREKFQAKNQSFFKESLASVSIRALYIPLTRFLMGLSIVVIYWYGGFEVIHGGLNIKDLYVFSAYIGMLQRPMWLLGMVWGDYQRMAAAGERAFEVIDATPEVKDKPDAKKLPPINGHVKFHEVSFGYEKDRPILKNITLEAKPGETVALLGPTGSGKSTIIRLLPRFYDVTAGKITVDGFDIRDVRLRSLRRQLGIVSQETFLFATTVKENIAYGKPNATMEEIVQAAKIAQAHDFIMQLPNGYDTMVGERGVTLSGGQQQRVAIARALLLNPKILILDDSTSSVDVDTEYEIQQALKALLKDRTTFVITQRVSTIRNADKIIVLENGEIVEEGTHKSLVAKRGAYYRIYQTLYEAQKAVTASKADLKQNAEDPLKEGNIGE